MSQAINQVDINNLVSMRSCGLSPPLVSLVGSNIFHVIFRFFDVRHEH
jgi:hypothetical protein